MRFDSTVGAIGIVSAMLAALSGCGGDVLPVGGPFGGGLDPAAVVDGGIVSDGNGVLPGTFTSGAGASPTGGAPTWTELYNTYLAVGTVGNCVSPCHAAALSGPPSPAVTFTWLQGLGYVGDTQPLIADPDFSCLTWSNGDMPPGGPKVDPTATGDFTAWAKAGAKNN